MIETTDKRGNTTPCKYRRRNPERFLRRKIRAIRLSGLQNSPQFAVGKKHQHIAVHFIMSRSRQNVAESLLPIQIGAEHPGRSHVLTDGQTACFRGLVGTHKPVAGSEPRKTSVLTENDGKEVAFHRYGTTVELHKLPSVPTKGLPSPFRCLRQGQQEATSITRAASAASFIKRVISYRF